MHILGLVDVFPNDHSINVGLGKLLSLSHIFLETLELGEMCRH